MKIFITGATGYIGHQLALTLASQENTVHILVRNPASPKIPVHRNIRVFIGDITDKESVKKAIAHCEQIYHTAAFVKIFTSEPSVFFKVNVDGTRNVLDASLEAGIRKLVYTSSCAVLGASVNLPKSEKDPRTESFDNDYEFTKFLAENLVKEHVHKGLFTVIVAPSMVYGPGAVVNNLSLNRFINNFIRGKITILPKPYGIVRNYCYIDDIVSGHILAMKHGLGGEKYILGGDNISYKTFFETIRTISGSKAVIIEAPKFILEIWALFQWCRYLVTRQEPIVTLKAIRHIFKNKSYSSNKAITKLGYQPTALNDALSQTIAFLNQKNHV